MTFRDLILARLASHVADSGVPVRFMPGIVPECLWREVAELALPYVRYSADRRAMRELFMH